MLHTGLLPLRFDGKWGNERARREAYGFAWEMTLYFATGALGRTTPLFDDSTLGPCGFTNSSACFGRPSSRGSGQIRNSSLPLTVGNLNIFSSESPGLVTYTVQSTTGTVIGQVVGPIATPEPDTSSLFGAGILGFLALRRFAAKADLTLKRTSFPSSAESCPLHCSFTLGGG